MKKFEKSSADVISIFSRITSKIDCERKKMFGYPVLFLNGNMFLGTFANKMFFRLRKERHTYWKDRNNAIKDFEPISGRKMKEYLEIECEERNIGLIEEMKTESEEYVRTLEIKK